MVHNHFPNTDIVEETDYFDDVDPFKDESGQEIDTIPTTDHTVKDKLIFSVSCSINNKSLNIGVVPLSTIHIAQN